MWRKAFIPFFAFAVINAAAAGQEPTKPAISVSSSAKVTAKADVAIVFMSIRSSSPLAADALEQNTKKIQTIKDRLAALGYKPEQVKFSGNRFAPAGGPGFIYGGGQRPTGFDVSNNLLIFIESTELADLHQFNSRASTLLDELSKLGASACEMPISRISMGGSSIVAFTVKDPTPYEKRAYQQAMENARPTADDIARRMNVQITGVESVTTEGSPRPTDPYPTPLDDVPYEYVSSSMDEVPIRVNLVVRYSFK